ncbi:O-methylsterigmatocystin oxidoreductase [Leucoagaricus sp. SymC.cos]|nr:O-methylsterigmatocystin oxidoreductase [Leucoagaricus sp. SymC.cos]
MDTTAILSTILGLSCTIALLARWRAKQRNPRSLPYPPSPPSQFLFGNLKDLPQGGNEWLKYEELGKRLGSDVGFLTVLGTPILFLNSFKATTDLLDKKGLVYSDRPRLVMIKELMGWSWNLVIMSYKEGFVAHRKIVQQHFMPNVVTNNYRGVMVNETHVLVMSLLKNPEHFTDHLKRLAGAIIMMVVYGHQVAPEGDEFVRLAEEVRESAEKLPPGTGLVDTFPILKYLPSWFPGAGFKHFATERRKLSMAMREAPYKMVKEKLARGVVAPSFTSNLLQEMADGADLNEELIQNCAGVIYSAGADTTSTALTNFFLAMMLYPEVQAKAQKLLDDIVGRSRLPDFNDMDSLPYIGCLVKETLRWKAVVPLGIPHFTTEASEYRNWYIPKATTVMANISCMLHDPTTYLSPDVFNPERFIKGSSNDTTIDPARIAFGFGRRVCPGRFFAEDSLWLAIACILQTTTISMPSDANEKSTVQGVTWTSGMVSNPTPFPCSIKPRFEAVERLISAME